MKTQDIHDHYLSFLPDKRIAKRVSSTLQMMIETGTCIVNKLVSSHTQKTGIYRMLSNERFTHNNLLGASIKKCSQAIDTDHVLVLQDTTEFNYHGINKKLKKAKDKHIGPTTNKNIAGYFCHPGLVIGPEDNTIYGLSSAIIYNRDWDGKNKLERRYSTLPIEEKESFRWIQTAENSKKAIKPEVRMTIIGDRESDIYEELLRVPDQRTDVLVRAKADRVLVGNEKKLFKYLETLSIKSDYDLCIKGNKKRKERVAKMEVRFSEITIKAPMNYKGEKRNLTLFAIEAREKRDSTPKGESAILWRLLTTHKVETAEQALKYVDWYKKRWFIEELFRVLKTKGFKIESSQLGSGSGLKKLLALSLEAAIRVMTLKLSLTQDLKKAANVLFQEKEIEFLGKLNRKYEGSTAKQKNPYSKQTLAWSAWIIARLGCWSGYISQGPPGYITIKDGYDKFTQQFSGYLLFDSDL